MIAQTSNISKAEINSFLFVISVQLYDCFYLYANSIGNKKRTKFPPSALPFIYLSNPIFFRHGHHHRHGFHHGHRRVRKDHTPENLAVIRYSALNLLKQEKTAKDGIHAKQLQAAWKENYLLKIIAAAN